MAHPSPSEPLQFEPNGLYLVLCDRNDDYTFHWGFYLASTAQSGVIHHLINQQPSGAWAYEAISSENTPYSERLLVGIKVAVMDPVLHDAMAERLTQVPVAYSSRFREDITCRVWIKEALFALDEEGFIKIVADITGIEREALSLAMFHKNRRTTAVTMSKYTQA